MLSNKQFVLVAEHNIKYMEYKQEWAILAALMVCSNNTAECSRLILKHLLLASYTILIDA